MDWKQITTERKQWVDKNFPPDVYEHSVEGMIEELGELAHHHLKMEQQIRGSDEEHIELMKDSVGDITIYMLGVMYHKDLYPTGATPFNSGLGTGRDIIFRLAGTVGQIATGKVAHSDIDTMVYLLKGFCSVYDWDFEEIVTETWDHVKQRDWTKNKQDGTPLKDNPHLVDGKTFAEEGGDPSSAV